MDTFKKPGLADDSEKTISKESGMEDDKVALFLVNLMKQDASEFSKTCVKMNHSQKEVHLERL